MLKNNHACQVNTMLVATRAISFSSRLLKNKQLFELGLPSIRGLLYYIFHNVRCYQILQSTSVDVSQAQCTILQYWVPFWKLISQLCCGNTIQQYHATNTKTEPQDMADLTSETACLLAPVGEAYWMA